MSLNARLRSFWHVLHGLARHTSIQPLRQGAGRSPRMTPTLKADAYTSDGPDRMRLCRLAKLAKWSGASRTNLCSVRPHHGQYLIRESLLTLIMRSSPGDGRKSRTSTCATPLDCKTKAIPCILFHPGTKDTVVDTPQRHASIHRSHSVRIARRGAAS